MVLRIPETGLQLESSAKTADALPLQAFAITLSNNVIEDLIQCVQNGEDVHLSLGNVPSFLYGKDTEVHKISRSSEITDLDLYLTDPSDSTQHAERLPHPTMSLFSKPPHHRYPRLAAGREVAREKTASKTPAARHKTQDAKTEDDFMRLKQSIQKANDEKKENSTKILESTTIRTTGAKHGATKGSKTKLLPGKTGSMATAISRSRPNSPALSGVISPSLNPTLSAAEQAKEEARQLRAPIVHELAAREMSFEELQSRWPNDADDFKKALDKVADFDDNRQKFVLKKLYWKELDVFNYDYDSDDGRQAAIDNAIRMYDRMRMSASEPVWDRLLPKEERGKGKCLSKLLPTIAKGPPQPAARTPQIKMNDGEDSSGSKNGDGSPSGTETKKAKKTSQPMSRQTSQTKQPAKKIERKWVGKKAATPKVSPTKAGGKSKDKAGRVLSKEFVSDSDSSSSEAPLSKTVPRAKKDSEDREKERERERERERQKEREKELREREREREREKERLEKQKEKEAAAPALKQKPKPSAPKEVIKPQVIARPIAHKRPREEADDDSSSSSGTPLMKRASKEAKAHSTVSYKRPPSDSSSQSSSRSNSYVGPGYSSKNKNTSPVKSSPLASSPPTNASDLDQQTADEIRHERERDRSRDRSVTVANGTINVKKRKMETEGDVIDVAVAEKKRQRLSTDILNEARTFKKCYEVYQKLHYELEGGGTFSQEKYETLLRQRKRLEGLKASIYRQMPRECY